MRVSFPLLVWSGELCCFSAHSSHSLPWHFGSGRNSARGGLCPPLPLEAAPFLLPPITPSLGGPPSAPNNPPEHGFQGFQCLGGTCHRRPCPVVTRALGLSLYISSLRTGTPCCSLDRTVPFSETFDKYLLTIRFDFIISIREWATLLCFLAIIHEVEGCCRLGKKSY